jgi:pimeloyl-ACP methyl ester carboxylesterase
VWKDYAATPVGQLLVRRAGPDDGVPLVLFHASPGSGRALEPLLEELAPGRPLYALDTLGVGGSARPTILRTPGIVDYAQVVVAALDDLDLGPIDLYGTHTGSLLALETAILLGDRVRSVVLNGVPLFSPDERAAFLDHHFVDLTPRWDGAELVMAWGHVRDLHHWFPWFDRRPERVAPRAPADADSLQAYLVDLLASGPSYVDPYRAVFLHDTRSRLPLLQAPTLVCHTSGDPLARFTTEAARLARAESLAVDGPLGPAVASHLDRSAA